MKKTGVINVQLAGLLAGLGHKDEFMIADGGMPIPRGVEVVDLALAGGVPSFRQVLDAVLQEVGVEHYILASEIHEANPRLEGYIKNRLSSVEGEYVSHDDLKRLEGNCKFVVRTGEYSPYPNVILRSGVAF